MSAIDDIAAERRRQVAVEGWTPDHDDTHHDHEMALAAIAYAISAAGRRQSAENWWPWDWKWWKPKTPRKDLVRAGALIVAEIERLDRAALLEKGHG
jgi:LmbE family N-acetylglucosaminyl deacetylase